MLSNNDGCVIARDQASKDLGIDMGVPYFKVKDELNVKGIKVFSSNYELYADMSRRVTLILSRFTPDLEKYSIDESFLCFDYDSNDVESERQRFTNLAHEIRQSVMQATGIPVRVSFAETKTLAKVGSDYAKKMLKAGKDPCVCFWEHPDKERFLNELDVRDLWGIGRAKAEQLARDFGINTARQLRDNLDETTVRKHYSVVTWRTVLELRGVSCIELEMVADSRKSIIRSRMFGKKINDINLISQAISTHTARAAEKLRREGLIANYFGVFISTGRHPKDKRMLLKSYTDTNLPSPTNDTLILNKFAMRLLEKAYKEFHPIFHKPYLYSKCGVVMGGLVDQSIRQENLFRTNLANENIKIMQCIDKLNFRYGKRSIVLASMGTPDELLGVESCKENAASWGMRRNMMSNRWTTNWDDILKVI